MSKRAHRDVVSPRSDSENEEVQGYLGTHEDPPLLPLRPPSVDSQEPLTFGAAVVDGVPVSLPVPRPAEPDETSQKLRLSHVPRSAVSPTAVTATPLGKTAVDGQASGHVLEVIPEREENEPEREGTESCEGKISSVGERRSRADSDSPRDRHGSCSPSRISVGSGPADEDVWPAGTNTSESQQELQNEPHLDPDCKHARMLKRRKADETNDGDSPGRVKSRARANESGPSTGTFEEVVTAPKPFALDLAVEMPSPLPDHIKFAPPVTPGSNDVPLYPLRPPSVSGCPEALRFGDEATLPTPGRSITPQVTPTATATPE